MNDEHELRPRDASFEQEDKAGLLKAGANNDAETAKRWKSAAADASRIPASLTQAYSGSGSNEDAEPATPSRGRTVSESFKTRTNQSSASPMINVALFLVILLVAGVFFCRYVLKIF